MNFNFGKKFQKSTRKTCIILLSCLASMSEFTTLTFFLSFIYLFHGSILINFFKPNWISLFACMPFPLPNYANEHACKYINLHHVVSISLIILGKKIHRYTNRRSMFLFLRHQTRSSRYYWKITDPHGIISRQLNIYVLCSKIVLKYFQCR